MNVIVNNFNDINLKRIHQLINKTNQFNLTTRRYTEGDIQNFINDSNSDVYAFSVSDKFGDSGITGLSIVTANGSIERAKIDTLLMSCRIIGRNIEYAFINYIIDRRKEKKILCLKAKYIKTQKNEQVNDYFEKCSFILTESSDSVRNYILDTSSSKYILITIKFFSRKPRTRSDKRLAL